MGAAVVLILVAVLVGVLVNVALRAWMLEDSRREAHLRDPRTHTLAFAIPAGADPATFELALSRAGFTSGIDRVGRRECLRIECDESKREEVRRALNGVPAGPYDGSTVAGGPVVFEDERQA